MMLLLYVSVGFSSDWHLSKRCSSSCHAQLDNLDCITSEVSSFFGVETPIGFTVVFVHVQKTILQPILTKLVFLVILTTAHIDLHEIWSPTSYTPTFVWPEWGLYDTHKHIEYVGVRPVHNCTYILFVYVSREHELTQPRIRMNSHFKHLVVCFRWMLLVSCLCFQKSGDSKYPARDGQSFILTVYSLKVILLMFSKWKYFVSSVATLSRPHIYILILEALVPSSYRSSFEFQPINLYTKGHASSTRPLQPTWKSFNLLLHTLLPRRSNPPLTQEKSSTFIQKTDMFNIFEFGIASVYMVRESWKILLTQRVRFHALDLAEKAFWILVMPSFMKKTSWLKNDEIYEMGNWSSHIPTNMSTYLCDLCILD